jgi:hypothetical protein
VHPQEDNGTWELTITNLIANRWTIYSVFCYQIYLWYNELFSSVHHLRCYHHGFSPTILTRNKMVCTMLLCERGNQRQVEEWWNDQDWPCRVGNSISTHCHMLLFRKVQNILNIFFIISLSCGPFCSSSPQIQKQTTK